MTVRIGSNISSLFAQRNLKQASDRNSTSYERLASGLRINRASDDAAGLAIANALNSDARVLTQAIRNVNDGISMASIADAALSGLSQVVTRQRELAEQAANGVLNVQQRKALHAEANALVDEFNRIVSSISFNGIKLYENGAKNISIQAGMGTANIIQNVFGDELARLVGDETFQTSVQYASGTAPRVIQDADVNKDGILDLVVSDNNDGRISVFLGVGDGTFKARVSYASGAANGLSLVDVNGDGNLDVVADSEGGASVNILLGNGDGTFNRAVTYIVGNTPRELRTADFNGDGFIDVATGNETDNTVSIILGNGDGTFKAASAYTIGDYDAVTEFSIGDINLDGRLDIVVPNRTDETMSLLLGNGDGTFAVQTLNITHSGGGARIDDVELSDVNDDGYLDLIYSDSQNASGLVSVQLGNGDATFKARQDYVVSSGPRSISMTDFNGDGYEDLVVTTEDNNTVNILFGNSDGTFRGVVSVAVGVIPRYVTTGDFNGDGVPDFATANTNGNTISVVLQNTEPTVLMPHMNLTSRETALEAMAAIDATLVRVNNERAQIGAFQQRLSFAVSSIAVMRENYMAASARILDADIATETAELVKNQILQQVTSALLAQINLDSKRVLDLLKFE